MASRWEKLDFEWKLLLAAFILTSFFLLVFSAILVLQGKHCGAEDCLLRALSAFSRAAFILLIVNVVIIIIFLFAFLHRKDKAMRKRRKR